MVQKESAKRGYMTSGEVKEHLKGIGTTNARITYLNDVLKKKGILSKQTQNNVYENLGQLYERKRDTEEARRFYSLAGNSEKTNEMDRIKYGEFMKNYFKSIQPHKEDAERLVKGFRKLGTESDIKHATRILEEETRRERKAYLSYIKEYMDDAVQNKKKMKNWVVKDAREEGFNAFHAGRPDAETSRTQPYKKMIRALEQAERIYKDKLGDTEKAQKVRKKIDKERKRLIQRIVHYGVKAGQDDEMIKIVYRGYSDNWGERYKSGDEQRDVEEALKVEEEKHQKRHGLEESLGSASLSILGFIGAIYFFSPQFTGNVISNMTNSSSNIVGAVFLIIGLVGGFFWMKKR